MNYISHETDQHKITKIDKQYWHITILHKHRKNLIPCSLEMIIGKTHWSK